MKKITAFLGLCFLSACVTTPPVTYDTQIAPDHGVLVTKVACIKGISSLSIYKATTTQGQVGPQAQLSCMDKNPAQMIALPEGHYYFGAVRMGKDIYIEESTAYKFSIKKDALNYIGNVSVIYDELHPERKKMSLQVSDRNRDNIKSLQAANPELLEKYEHIKALAFK